MLGGPERVFRVTTSFFLPAHLVRPVPRASGLCSVNGWHAPGLRLLAWRDVVDVNQILPCKRKKPLGVWTREDIAWPVRTAPPRARERLDHSSAISALGHLRFGAIACPACRLEPNGLQQQKLNKICGEHGDQ